MRNRIDAYFSGAVSDQPAMVVLAEQLSARVGSMSVESMQADASHWVGNQGKLRHLLTLDGVVIGADNSLAAEACGLPVSWSDDNPVLPEGPAPTVLEGAAKSGRQTQAIEAVTRLCQTERANTGCIAMMTGPVTLSQQLFGDAVAHLADVKPLAVELAEQFCQARPDLLLLREGRALGQGEIAMPQRKAFNTLKNMAAYFDVPVGLYLEDYQPEILADLAKLKLPFLWLGADMHGNIPDPGAIKQLVDDFTGLGLPVAFEQPEHAKKQAAAYAEVLSGDNYLLTSLGELSRDQELESLITLTRELHD